MIKKYILTKSEPRGETVDTLILFQSKTPAPLEEIILSTWEECEYETFNDFLDFGHTKEEALSYAKTIAFNFANRFQITPVCELED